MTSLSLGRSRFSYHYFGLDETSIPTSNKSIIHVAVMSLSYRGHIVVDLGLFVVYGGYYINRTVIWVYGIVSVGDREG